MKGALKALTPPVLWKLGSSVLARARRDHGDSRVRIGRFEILVPRESLLSQLGDSQPHRNLAVGIIARFVGNRDSNSTIIDVGANVGGTAAMIATFCRNPLVLVEPSERYRAYLTKNSELFPNQCRLIKGIVTDGSVKSPSLKHNRGTARVVDLGKGQESPVLQLRLGEVESNGVGLVKIDTDGWDFKIIEDSLAWLEKQAPILYFEAEIDTLEALSDANRVVEKCCKIGYRSTIVWDDAGFQICATEQMQTVGDLFNYLFECRRQPLRTGLFSYNVGLFHEKDRGIFEQVASRFRDGIPVQSGRVKFDE